MSADPPSPEDLSAGVWTLDPARSSVEFQVPNFWGLTTVKGHFERYEGKLDLQSTPGAELTIEAASLSTRNSRRDKHLRSSDFFDVEHHPQVRFTSESAELDGQTLAARGSLDAAGKSVPLDMRATINVVNGEPVIEAQTTVDRRDLGMTWNRVGMVGTASTLIVTGTLVRESS
jgi:polyisoprenoid-binding protein YceI